MTLVCRLQVRDIGLYMFREWNGPWKEWSVNGDCKHLMGMLAVCDVSLQIIGP